MRSSSWISASLQVGAVFLGQFWGVTYHYPFRPPWLYLACAQLAGLLMLGGVFASLVSLPVESARHRTAVCIASLLYSVGVVLCEPFISFSHIEEIVMAALIQVPLLLAMGYLVRGSAWVSVAGVALFVFTSNVMIASNANSSIFRSGFFDSRIS